MRKILLFGIVLMLGLAACSESDVSVTGVRLNSNTLTLTVGETERLIAAVLPESATNQNVTWNSDNIAVATVDAQGTIRAVSAGTAIITVKTADGGRTATATVTVKVPVTGVTLDEEEFELAIGSTKELIATVLPTNATNQNVVWSSDDESVATVDDDGVVAAVSEGEAIITVRTEDGNFTATAIVTVIDNTTDEGVMIGNVLWATRNVGAPGTFVRYPENKGMLYQWNRRLGWSSTNPMVNSDGGTTWNSTAPTSTTWETANDPCPTGWRVPTSTEMESLAGAGFEWATRNGVDGQLIGTAPNQIFLPFDGERSTSGSLRGGTFVGTYWSSTGMFGMAFVWSFDGFATNFLANGFSVRCVAE